MGTSRQEKNAQSAEQRECYLYLRGTRLVVGPSSMREISWGKLGGKRFRGFWICGMREDPVANILVDLVNDLVFSRVVDYFFC